MLAMSSMMARTRYFGSVRDHTSSMTNSTCLSIAKPALARFLGAIQVYGAEGHRPSRRVGIAHHFVYWWAVPTLLCFLGAI